jgi:hypothetical protein
MQFFGYRGFEYNYQPLQPTKGEGSRWHVNQQQGLVGKLDFFKLQQYKDRIEPKINF